MSRRILVIDDDAMLLSCIGRSLKAAGHSVLTAGDGFAGEQLARAARPDLVLLDMRMPGRTGLATFESLRNAAETRHIPVVMLSGCDDDLDIARRAGADQVLLKPVAQRNLVEAVAQLLRSADAPCGLAAAAADASGMAGL